MVMEMEPLLPAAAAASASASGDGYLCWDRFLHKKTIRVLLVETDDSTRHIVTALLRHCMYQVIPAQDAHQAWQYLQDMHNTIDLVLTELVMPGLSGNSLLTRIMAHNICKNIPVIIMSSNDAMGTVFKCLSKGAVDFLVKPIRKNELKNLWQHVWRRCHSSSGGGSESGIQTQKCAKSKSGDESNYNSGSNYHNDDVSMGLNARDGSDNGSGTQAQSSWTKRAVEIDSPQAMYPDQSADPHDSTCAQVTHPEPELCSNRWLSGDNNKSCKKQKETNDESKGKDLGICGLRNLNKDDQSSRNERSIKPRDKQCEYRPQNNSKETMMEEPIVRAAADLIGSMAKNMDAQQAARGADAPGYSSKEARGKEKKGEDGMPSLELSLKRSRSTADHGANAIQEEQRNVLRRSDLSAFTRYHISAASNLQGGTGFAGSCSPHDNCSEAGAMMKSISDAAPPPNGSSNNNDNDNDMGSTTKNAVTPSAINANAHTSAFHPVQQRAPNAAGKDKADDQVGKSAGKMGGEAESKRPAGAIHDSDENGGSAGGPQCGSSNVFDPPAPVEGHSANYGSNSGSNNNGGNAGEAPDVEAGGINKSGNVVYMKRLAQRHHRVAAVTKFREKRKERNFGKKVRYQSRKRLAEQRPRVRGQFVRQAAAAAVEDR